MRRRLVALSGCGEMRPDERPLGPLRRRTVTTFCRALGVSSAAQMNSTPRYQHVIHALSAVIELAEACDMLQRRRSH
jgi:hypothetical protein